MFFTANWKHTLKFQICAMLTMQLLLFIITVSYILYNLEQQKYLSTLSNKISKLNTLASDMAIQSKHYLDNAPRDYPTYYRDLNLYNRDIKAQVENYNLLIQSIDDNSPFLETLIKNWYGFKRGLSQALGTDEKEPKLEAGSKFIVHNAAKLNDYSQEVIQLLHQKNQKQTQKLIIWIFITLIISVILFFMLFRNIQSSLIKPVNQLIESFGLLYKNEDYQLNINTNNEIAWVADAFNQHAKKLQAIFSLTDAVNYSRTVDETLQHIFDKFNKLIPIHWIGLFSINYELNYLINNTIITSRKNRLQSYEKFELNNITIHFSKGRDSTLLINDLQEHYDQQPKDTLIKILLDEQLQSAFIIPLFEKQNESHIVVIASSHHQAFQTEHRNLLSLIGNQILSTYAKTIFMESLVISAISGMAKLAENRDPETGNHLIRIANYSVLIAEELARDSCYKPFINREYIKDIKRFAPMHDIGKVGVNDDILLKPGALTKEERQEMLKHTLIGGNVLRHCEKQVCHVGHSIFTIGIEIAECHHEKYNGSGYPRGLSGNDIPLSARIVAAADVFDALTSKRPYKNAWPIEAAMEYMQDESGRHFDPIIIKALQRSLPNILQVYEQYKHI